MNPMNRRLLNFRDAARILPPCTIERRTGEVLAETVWKGRGDKVLHDERLKLSDIGISESSSHRWQTIARWPSAWQSTLEGILETGRKLIDAKAALIHGEWLPMVERLPFGVKTAQIIMRVAVEPRFANTKYTTHLPPSVFTLATLFTTKQLDDATFDGAVEAEVVRPDMKQGDMKAFLNVMRSAGLTGGPLPNRTHGVIYADPPWDRETVPLYGEMVEVAS